MILDTNFLIDLLENKGDAAEKLRELRKMKSPLLIPPGVLYELYTGAGSEKEVRRIKKDLNRAKLSPAVEKEAARIRKKLVQRGEPISSVDYLITGTARQLNEKILTNDQNMEKVSEVEVENF